MTDLIDVDDFYAQQEIRTAANNAFKANDVSAAEKALHMATEHSDPDLIIVCRTIVGKLYVQQNIIDLPDAKKAVLYERQFKKLYDLFAMTNFDMRSFTSGMMLTQSLLRRKYESRPDDEIEKYLTWLEKYVENMIELLNTINLNGVTSWLDDDDSENG